MLLNSRSNANLICSIRRRSQSLAVAIKKIPLDQVEKVFKGGIVLTGGGSMIHGLDIMMEKVLGISVKQPSDPIDSVAKGLSIVNSKIPVKGKAGKKNVTSDISRYFKETK